MAGKVGKIILDIVLSLMFFIVSAIIIDSIAAAIFGSKANGDADVNGYVMLVINSLITIGFGIWFYKYVSIGKKKTPGDN